METVVGMVGRVRAALIGWFSWGQQLEVPSWAYEYLDAIFIIVMLVSLGIWCVEVFWFTRKVHKVDMSLIGRLDPDKSKWPYIVLFYPVLHELEKTMDTTFAYRNADVHTAFATQVPVCRSDSPCPRPTIRPGHGSGKRGTAARTSIGGIKGGASVTATFYPKKRGN